MDGVIMLKLLRRAILLTLVVGAVYMVYVFKDRKVLNDQIIRLHVVGASDSAEDQNTKLLVRDAVLNKLRELTSEAASKKQVQQILSQNLAVLQDAANQVLQQVGSPQSANVTLQKEAFGTRVYDTFSLPAGVYDSLRIVIGAGEGRNWWCVVFPGLCVPAASEEVEDVAVSAGFSEELGKTLTGEEPYEIRFLLLDWLGRVENFFFDD